jgi:hypothetical protein
MKTLEEQVEEFEAKFDARFYGHPTEMPIDMGEAIKWLKQALLTAEKRERERVLKDLKRRIQYDMRKETDPSEIVYDLLDTIDLKLEAITNQRP